MPPGPGGGGGGGGGGVGGGTRRGGGGGRTHVNVREGSEDIRKFLSFYKRRNSLCVDLYLPAFYQKKPTYEDLAEFVYTVLSVGGVSPPNVIRAGVQDIQLHPVKKLLFIKFTEQQLRDEVVMRLQAGLMWPAFDTTVTGWSMDKPVERIRVLGTSPETNEGEIRKVLGQYGEILDSQKGYISKKLPGCTNGIWTVRLALRAGMSLPPFLIMKDEGEVWQLATGEASVCWKCGQGGHIGDKCRQAVNTLAESIASTAVGDQPSWAHVVKGGVSVAPQPPPLPPRVLANPNLFRYPFKATSAILKAAKSALKAVVPKDIFDKNAGDAGHNSSIDKVANEMGTSVTGVVATAPDASATEPVAAAAASMEVQVSAENIGEDTLPTQSQPKKAKLSSGVDVPRDPRLRNKGLAQLSTSPALPHKVPAGGELLRHGPVGGELHNSQAGEELRHGPAGGELRQGVPADATEQPHTEEGVDEVPSDVLGFAGNSENKDDCGVKTNMFGVNFIMWFEIGIEGKDPMDQEEDDWGGTIQFGFSDKTFDKDIEDYFAMFEDECSIQSHYCAGRVARVLDHARGMVIGPPDYDPRSIVGLLDKYGDAHVSNSGWREVDPEEWFDQN